MNCSQSLDNMNPIFIRKQRSIIIEMFMHVPWSDKPWACEMEFSMKVFEALAPLPRDREFMPSSALKAIQMEDERREHLKIISDLLISKFETVLADGVKSFDPINGYYTNEQFEKLTVKIE